ncbi:MAG: DUF4280 domain-containing protein [Gammaproteobacteria bacterium]|nr:DUF4280 domain-containing protein [Gammaproteobacteria bacterium]
MGLIVCSSAMIKCSFGTAPRSLTVLPKKKVITTPPIANIMDNVPMLNIMPFAMCSSIANPSVASATAAALGVLTPMPCIPVTTAPWAPGSSTVLVANMPALNNSSKLMCNWAGVIEITNAGQSTIKVP